MFRDEDIKRPRSAGGYIDRGAAQQIRRRQRRVACAGNGNGVTCKRPVGKTSDGCDSGRNGGILCCNRTPLTPASCSPMEISSLADTADPQRTETTAVAAAIERCLREKDLPELLKSAWFSLHISATAAAEQAKTG